MQTKQFHDEAVLVMSPSRLAARTDIASENSRLPMDVVMPLLLRMKLHGWISDDEKDFLDRLAPANSLVFLLNNLSYVHPEGVELFPFEAISSAVNQRGEAIFSHRYRIDRFQKPDQQYRIYTAWINPNETTGMILGFFGPDYRLGNPDEEHRFAHIVEDFRRAYAAMASRFGELRSHLDRKRPTILLNRSSGRVLAANALASRLMAWPARALVNSHVDQLQTLMSPLLSRFRLKMDNLSISDMELSVMTLEPMKQELKADCDAHHYFVERLRSCVSNLTLAASHVADTAFEDSNDGSTREQIGQIIVSESRRLNDFLNEFNLVYDFDRVPCSEHNLQSETERALDRLDAAWRRKGRCHIDCAASVPDFSAPEEAYAMLLAAALRAHGWNAETRTLITIDDFDNRSKVTIRVVSAALEVVRKEPVAQEERAFIACLSEKLGGQVTRNVETEDDQIVTEITLSK